MLSKIIGYEVHLAGFAWRQGVVYDGMAAGTEGHGVRIEAIMITGLPPGFQYRAHVAGVGWLNWMNPGETAGTTGEARALEALQFRWKGDATRLEGVAPGEIWGRAYVAERRWLPASSGMEPNAFGTTGQGLQMEAIQLWLVIPQEDAIGTGLASGSASFAEVIADSDNRPQYPSLVAMIETAAETTACMASLGAAGAVCVGTEGLRCVSPEINAVAACTSAVTGGVAMFEKAGQAEG